MPFGLVNAPATFKRLMEVVLTGLAREGCMVYLDDVLVVGITFEEHNNNLVKVFERLKSAGLTLKPEKCKLAQTEVCYLGHVVSAEGVVLIQSNLKLCWNTQFLLISRHYVHSWDWHHITGSLFLTFLV